MARALIDWRLAERTADAIAGAGSASETRASANLSAAVQEALEQASAYSGLAIPAAVPQPESVDRRGWSRAALATLAEAARPLEERLAAEVAVPGPFEGVVRGLIGAGAAAEAGLAVGYAARRVLGQYDIALFGDARPSRLLFVAPNIDAACTELRADPALFRRWIALHESTHVLQLESVPWLVPHLRALVGRLLGRAAEGIEGGQLAALARRLVRDPRELFRTLLRGELARMLAGPADRAVFDRLQATMAVIEGHAEHVMDACAADDPRLSELRRRLDARRAGRRGLGEVVARLLG
ncbi:MAG TPA: zinc-dependent metalloprotease, partial [Solirubrobacterales bacterium]|nr:zinc-dependent metalloprotease [Solirubrobacterales bacterium]